MPACPAGRELAMIIIPLFAKIFAMARFDLIFDYFYPNS
jgi:hypothetical protein